MGDRTSDWKEELGRFLKPFLDRLGHKARRQMCPLYVSGLIGPGDRKSIAPMAERLALGEYDQLHHFIADGVWDAAPVEAELLASLPAVKTGHPSYSGIRGIYFAENWEDKEDFSPYIYVDVTEDLERWERAVKQYEFIRGGISSYPYFEHYKALARVRGAESGWHDAVAFDIDAMGKKRVFSALP